MVEKLSYKWNYCFFGRFQQKTRINYQLFKKIRLQLLAKHSIFGQKHTYFFINLLNEQL
jgi:hypothetical protein